MQIHIAAVQLKCNNVGTIVLFAMRLLLYGLLIIDRETTVCILLMVHCIAPATPTLTALLQQRLLSETVGRNPCARN